jgi:hypothetical protein
MKKSIIFFVITILAGTVALSCKTKPSAPDSYYVAAISSGVLGKTDPVTVEFTQSQDVSKPLANNVFTISPSVKGSASWLNEFTLVFTPAEPYKPGRQYRVRLNLSGIPPFDFDFMSATPIFNVQLDPVRINSDDDVMVIGTVSADDDAQLSVIEQTVTSKDLGKPTWLHESGVHRFFFNNVNRGNAPRNIQVTWDGKPLGATEKGNTTVVIPGRDIFQMIDLRFNDGVIEVSFSSPLKPNQDMRGFVSLSGNTNVRYSQEGNMLKIFGDNSGGIPLGAELLIQDLEDINGKRLNTPVQFTVPDRWELPEIRFAGTGVILPTSQGSNLVVETRNVSGILVEAFHIYGQNMLQFLQVNSLAGNRELDRVGEPVWTKALDFPWTAADQNRWVRRLVKPCDFPVESVHRQCVLNQVITADGEEIGFLAQHVSDERGGGNLNHRATFDIRVKRDTFRTKLFHAQRQFLICRTQLFERRNHRIHDGYFAVRAGAENRAKLTAENLWRVQ